MTGAVVVGVGVAAFAAGAVAGAWAWQRLRPRWVMWRDRPRESREDRVMRLVRSYAGHAADLAAAYQHLDALRWARKACRLDPSDPRALLAMGEAHLCGSRWGVAEAYFLRAHTRLTETLPGVGRDRSQWIARAAHGVASCHGHRSRHAGSAEEFEHHVENAVAWLQTALEHEPGLADEVCVEAAFVHLASRLQGVLQRTRPAALDHPWMEP